MKHVLGWVWRYQYASAIWRTTKEVSLCQGRMASMLEKTYRLWFDLRVWMIKFVGLGPLNVNHTINNGVRDVNALRAEFSRQ